MRRPTRVTDGGAPAPRPNTHTLRGAVATDGPRVMVPTPGGALLVRAVNHEATRASEIVATRFDPDGRAMEAPRVLRRTTGPVVSVDASARGEAVWVAWSTQRKRDARDDGGVADEENLQVVMKVSPDLAHAERPVTVADFSRPQLGEMPYGWDEPSIEVLAMDDGSAAVLATGPNVSCLHEEGTDHAERARCPSWYVGSVSAAGAVHVSSESTLCPPGAPHGLTRIPGGFVYAFADDHPGTKQNLQVESSLAHGMDETFYDHSDVRVAWTGVELVTVQTLDAAMFDLPAQDTIFVETIAGVRRTPTHMVQSLAVYPRVTSTRVRCTWGRPTVTLAWAGGSVVLDPGVPEASMTLGDWIDAGTLPLPPVADAGTEREGPLAWAGRAIVGLVDEVPRRWVCAGPNGALRLAP